MKGRVRRHEGAFLLVAGVSGLSAIARDYAKMGELYRLSGE